MTGTREPASALRLLSGGAWLGNSSAGTLSHVEGYTGSTDAQATVGKAGDPFEVVQRASGAYVLDLRTGRLSRLDDATLGVADTTTEPGAAAALQVVTGSTTTWVVDRSSGILQQLNPTTLAPIGNQIALGGPTGAATVDQTGSIWVPVAAQAVVDEASPAGTVTRHPFGRSGDAVQLADTSGGVWAVDPQSAVAGSLQHPSLHRVALPGAPPTRVPLVGASPSSPQLVIVAGPQVLAIDTAQPALSSLALPAAAQSNQVAVASDRAYLLDAGARQLESIGLDPLRVLPPIPVSPGADQLISKDQLVFVNSAGTAQALVVNASGAVTAVSKYVPVAARATPGRAAATTAAGNGSAGRGPAPASNPAGPASAASAAGGPAVTAPAVSPPTTASTATAPPATIPASASPTTGAPPPTQPPTVPGVPVVTQVSAGDGVITVSWAAPASDGGSPVLGYQVTATPSGSRRSVGAGSTSATLAGQPDGTRECVQVQARNSQGGGPLSPAGQDCATPLKDSPGPVGGVRASESAPGQINLSWTAPSLGPYHTPIGHYTVRGATAPLTVTATIAMLRNLSAGTTYAFTVVATNQSGNSGSASATTDVSTWSAPNAVANLSVTGGDGQLTIKWKAATVPSGSPKPTGYMVAVGKGSPSSTTNTTVTRTVPAWTNERVTVYAVNSVGNGPRSTGTGTAWARASTRLCVDSLNGDRAIENDCSSVVSGGAWTDQGASGVDWVHFPASSGGRPAGTNEYLCTTYYRFAPGLTSTGVSGDVYALVTTPTNAACTKRLPNYQTQPPDIPHPIAYVSTTQIDSASRHICEYEGLTTGSGGTFTAYELSPCGTKPTGMSRATQKFSFWT